MKSVTVNTTPLKSITVLHKTIGGQVNAKR